MLPYENMVADYVKETNNHVLYRVTPVFEGNNLVATEYKWKQIQKIMEKVLNLTYLFQCTTWNNYRLCYGDSSLPVKKYLVKIS